MAKKVSEVQQAIDRRRIVLNAVWWLLPVSSRRDLWGDFYETYRSPWQLIRKTLKVIWGAIHGHVMLELVGMQATDDDPAVRYDRMLALIEQGFRKPEAVRRDSSTG